MSDAGHNLGDVFSLLLALIAFKLSATKPNERFTYGYRKGSVLISLLNAIILLVAVGAILLESIHKFANPAPVDGSAIAWTAAAGIVVNGFTAYLLMRHQKNDINTRGAFLHMAADTLVSVGVVISGIVISLTGWTVIDPIVSIIIAVVILVSTWQLLSESVRMSIDAVPSIMSCAKRMPSTRSSFSEISAAISSVWLIRPAVIASRWPWPLFSMISVISSMLLIMPIEHMA